MGEITALTTLWLPILLSAVVVFIASSLIHMVLPWHKSDFRQVPNQDKVMETLRPFAIPPGDYMLPRATSFKETSTLEFTEKLKKGPVMILTVLPNGPMSMGLSLVLWFVYTAMVSFFAAYVGGRAVPPGAEYLDVFRFVGTTAFIGYSVALWQMWIWDKRAWSTMLKMTIDGLVYALLTAGVFGWLWP